MKKIRITSVPPGFAPEDIRKQWLGVEIPLTGFDNNPEGLRMGIENMGGYKVNTQDAIDALRTAGKEDAANFWENFNLGSTLVFKQECCEIVG